MPLHHSANSSINDYSDMIHLPHPISAKHPPMPIRNRTAQFAPFAALTRHRDIIQKQEENAEKSENNSEFS